MANSLFIKADEVAELLGVSRAEAYRIIKRLNDQLSSRGFIVVNGRVNRKYLEEQIYGFCRHWFFSRFRFACSSSEYMHRSSHAASSCSFPSEKVHRQ